MCNWYTQDIEETIEHMSTECAGHYNEKCSLTKYLKGIVAEN